MVSALEKVKEFLDKFEIKTILDIKEFRDILHREKWILQIRLIKFSFGRTKFEVIFCKNYLDNDFYLFDFPSKAFFDRKIMAIDSHDVEMTYFKKYESGMDGLIKNLLREFKFINYYAFLTRHLYDIVKESEDVTNQHATSYAPSIKERKKNAEKERKRRSTKRFEEEWKDYYKNYTFRMKNYDYDKFWENVDLDNISEKDRLKIIEDVEKKEIRIKAKNIKEAREEIKDLIGDNWEEDYFQYNTNALKEEPIKITLIKSGKIGSRTFLIKKKERKN